MDARHPADAPRPISSECGPRRYVNDPVQAQSRYGKEELYQKIFAKVDELVAAPAFTSATLASLAARDLARELASTGASP